MLPSTPRVFFLFLALLFFFALPLGCSGEEIEEPVFIVIPDDDGDGAAEGDGDDSTLRVPIDLDESFDAPNDGVVRVFQATTEADLIGGEVAQGQIGDWILENEQGRYLIGLGDRAIGPCAWDGNPLEVEKVIDGQRRGSVLGQICLLLNVAQTFKPEYVEVVEDGSQGRAILAITGYPAPLDFLNLTTMVSGFAPGLIDNIDLDPDRPLPFTITVYYALTPESPHLRVLTALRNDGEEREHFIGAHLVLSGSSGSYFTPLGTNRGWGYASLGPGNFSADPVSYLGYFSRDGGYAVLPDADESMEYALPVGAGMLAVSGAAGLVYGATDILPLLLARRSQWDSTPGFIGVNPDEVATLGYRLYPGTGSLSSATDPIFAQMGIETHELSGQVLDFDGAPSEGVKVSFLKDGTRTYTASWTDQNGRFQVRLPSGNWEVRLRDDLVPTVLEPIELEEDLDLGEVQLMEPALVTFQVRTPEGAPLPARIVIACEGDCGIRRPNSRELDPLFQAPNGWLRVLELGPTGEKKISLSEGLYRVSANRGMTYSVWPDDATTTGGALFQFLPGDDELIEIELAEVVDTSGTLSADFHIHAMMSPDSQVSNQARVLDFLAGGLDVMVSSDHDGVADFGPAIEALGAEHLITSLVGNEITSSNLGHINVFPLEIDENARRGGPLDWSREGTYHLTLQEVIDATREHPGEQVIQLNHPRIPMGAIGNLQVDVLTGQSFADPASLRMRSDSVDPVTGDTGLWSEEFDALEVLNGFNLDNFWSVFRWWLTMVGRGFSPAATAVSDTHGIYGSLGASPRSFVLVDADKDHPTTLDIPHFVDRVRKGALIGTNGPFLRVSARNQSGERVSLSETLDASQGQVTLEILIERPDWIDVDTIDLFVNLDADTLVPGAPGEAITAALTSTLRIPVSWDPELHRELVASGSRDHYRWRQVIEVPLVVDQDSYVVVMARGLEGRAMRPVLSSSIRPLAYSNPIFLDFDGNGYDNPPLAASRAERLALSQRVLLSTREAFQSQVIIAPGEELTADNLSRLFEALRCDHDHHHGDGHHHSHDHHHHQGGHHHGHGHHHH